MKYAILDIETTGLDPEHSSIIEIGAILISDNKIESEFHSFISYKKELPEEIKRLTGIREDELCSAPPLEDVLENLKVFIEKLPVVSHNGLKFDFPMLEHAGFKIVEKYDSIEFAFFILPTHELGHSASALAKRYGFGETPHRALEDCKLEFEIIKCLQKEYEKKPVEKAKALKALAERIGWWWSGMLTGPSEPIDHISSLVSKHEPYRKKDETESDKATSFEKIDVKDVESRFIHRPGESKASDYSEDRPEQRNMAGMIANAFNEQKHLVIEAGTGTGKSKAYLVPSVIFALKNKIPVIVATHTKALQDQLFFKEILHLKEIVDPNIRVAVLKGKRNYICLKKFEDFVDEVLTELSQRSLYEFGKTGAKYTSRLACILIAAWVLETERGDWDELPYWLKDKIPKRVEQDICNWDELCIKEVCDFYDEEKCFLAKARLRAKDADLVIANHAIVLSGIIPSSETEDAIVDEDQTEEAEVGSPFSHAVFPTEAKFLVIDEVHHLEDDATSAWTKSISQIDMELLMEQLYGKRSIKGSIDSIAKLKNSKRLYELATGFSGMESDTKLASKNFFTNILPVLVSESSYEGGTSYRSFEEIDKTPEHKKVLIDTLKDLEERMRAIVTVINVFVDEATLESVKKTLVVRSRNVTKIADTLSILVSSDEFYVRFLERTKAMIEVKAAPLSVAPILKERVYDNFSSVILTSATITVGKKFNYFAGRCGTGLVLKEKIDYKLLNSSFDYRKQAQFFVARGITYNGNTEQNITRHLDACAEFLEQAIIASNGGALVLCSSHSQVGKLYTKLVEPLAKKSIWLLKQSKGSSVNSVVRDFTEDVNSVLIGTQSLWQGVDVPGNSLRTLFILKIPYLMFNVPIIQARRNEIDRQGRSSFAEYYEPLAAMALKQGFGRLIRKATDKGIAIMLDERILTKPTLMNSFPDGVELKGAEKAEIITALEEQTKNL